MMLKPEQRKAEGTLHQLEEQVGESFSAMLRAQDQILRSKLDESRSRFAHMVIAVAT